MSEIVNPIEERFEIDSDQKADWALRKIAEARADAQKWIDYYTEQIEKIKAQAAEDTANLEQMLYSYFQQVPHKKAKASESYPLPSGKLVWKQQSPEYERDDEKVIGWCKANGDEKYVKVKESLDWAELKKAITVLDDQAITADGEVIPGIKVIARENKFSVEVK